MTNKYSNLLNAIKQRTNPDQLLEDEYFNKSEYFNQKDIFKYIIRAMRGVDEAYTKRTKEAGNKVKSQLEKSLTEVDFEFQGSVMTNTHIKGYSDIDLLTISNKFYSTDLASIKKALDTDYWVYSQQQRERLRAGQNASNYTGDAIIDLRQLRQDSEGILAAAYSQVDISKPKCIEVQVTNPQRKVDVVIANWYQNANYYIYNEKAQKGIQIYDKDLDEQLPADFPFLSIQRINEKSALAHGRLEKMIRMLKTLKGDIGEILNQPYLKITLSSFDINAIFYDVDVNSYGHHSEIELIDTIFKQLYRIFQDRQYRLNLKSVDGYEKIFIKDGVEDIKKVEEISWLLKALEALVIDIKEEAL